MARTYKSTYYYHIGSNWYYRYDSTGNKIKTQLAREEYNRRNNIISSQKERRKLPPKPPVKRPRKPRVKKYGERIPLDQTVFQNDRPKRRVSIRIYIQDEETEVMELLDKYDVSPANYFTRFLWYFNMYYDAVIEGMLYYEQSTG